VQANGGSDVIVISHRRSGTHFAIDAIRNNFPDCRGEHLDLDHLRPSHPARMTPRHVEERRARGPVVFKSHALPEPERSFGDAETSDFVRRIVERARIVYVHRDGRDVCVSLYFYARNFDPAVRAMAFGEFLRMNNEFDAAAYDGDLTRVEYWCRHVEGWTARPDVFAIGFSDLLERFDETVGRLASFLDRPAPRTVCKVRRRALGGGPLGKVLEKLRTRLDARFSSVGFRKGVAGDHVRHFAPEDSDYFDAIAGETMRRLGYYR
jgi:hypothetical protein